MLFFYAVDTYNTRRIRKNIYKQLKRSPPPERNPGKYHGMLLVVFCAETFCDWQQPGANARTALTPAHMNFEKHGTDFGVMHVTPCSVVHFHKILQKIAYPPLCGSKSDRHGNNFTGIHGVTS